MTFIQNNPLSRRKSSPCNANGDEKTISEIREEPGSSNAGKYPGVKKFCGPAGGAAEGTYPVNTPERIASAKKLAHNAPNPEGIIACANRAAGEDKKESVSRRSSEEDYIPTNDISMGDGMADYSTQALEDQNKGLSRHGSMKGDQSATHTDYANYKGTDKGYHGHTGASHGDQSATHRDYMGNMGRHHIDPRTKR